jgi:hypothetical protein
MVCYGSCSRSKMLPPVWSLQCNRKFDYIKPVLRGLHWLPVRQRVTFKIALLVYKINAYTGLHHRISLISVNPFPASSLADSVYDLLLVARCSFQEPEQSLMRAASLSMQSLLSGIWPTCRPTVSRPLDRHLHSPS